jgi:hypothetical protein
MVVKLKRALWLAGEVSSYAAASPIFIDLSRV